MQVTDAEGPKGVETEELDSEVRSVATPSPNPAVGYFPIDVMVPKPADAPKGGEDEQE